MADIDVSYITEALNNKVDRDLNNITTDLMQTKFVYPTPDYSRGVQIASAGSVINYTAPENGVIIGNYDSAANGNITCNGFVCVVGGNDAGNEGPFSINVCKDDVVVSPVATRGAYFVPYKYVKLGA